LPVAIIINPISGGATRDAGRDRAELASALLERAGEPGDVFVTERRGHARQLAQAAVQRAARLVLVWGGDGTINEVASALAFHETPLGIVPAGSGNGLARELGISAKPAEAIRGALAARPRAIDLGELGGRLFVNVAGIGFDAAVAAEFDRPGNRGRGFLAYAGITARTLLRYVPASYRVQLDGERLESRAVLVTVANSPQFGNGARIAPGARVDDGRLDLVIVGERARWRTIWQMRRLFTGTVDRVPDCIIRQITRATIESDRPMPFHVDGEPVEGDTRLEARVHPGALRVAVG
jgi:YegS/Rv2252/BmrU family lipid kinase